MTINGYTLTTSELGQAWREYQRIIDKEEMEYAIQNLICSEQISEMCEEEIEKTCEDLVDDWEMRRDSFGYTDIEEYLLSRLD